MSQQAPDAPRIPRALWRTRRFANGREGSSAKCAVSARESSPSQNSASSGPSRRRPRCQDSSAGHVHPQQPAPDTAAARGGPPRRPRRARRAPAAVARDGSEAAADPVVRRRSARSSPRASGSSTCVRQPSGPAEELLVGGEVVQVQHGRAAERRRRAGRRRWSCPIRRARRRRPAAPGRRRAAARAAERRARSRPAGAAGMEAVGRAFAIDSAYGTAAVRASASLVHTNIGGATQGRMRWHERPPQRTIVAL